MKYDREKVNSGHYIGLTDWLTENFGEEGVRWKFVRGIQPGRVGSVWFADEKDEVVALLRWS